VFLTTSRQELERRFPALKKTLAAADGLWIAWPKKASTLETDLGFPRSTGDRVRCGSRRQQERRD
jgi:hypothetical protein